MSDTIERLIAGSYPDPDSPGTLQVATRSVVIAESLAGTEGELVSALGLGRRLALVSDPATHEVLGDRVCKALAANATVQHLALPAQPHADADTVSRLREASRDADALVAVGSGTINDLCKYAAFEDAKPYVVFATAPSMNGYTSVSAAITVEGHKRSLPAAVPQGIFVDLAVLAAAPPRMIRAGFGDSLCRPTAQADWLLAHSLRGDAYREAPFALLAEDEDALLAEPEAFLRGDLGAMARLARTLVLSGFGMTLCGGSYPASQGEHLISHYADMMADAAWSPTLHGEQIGVTTLTLARLQERMLGGDAPRLVDAGPDEAAVIAHFGAALGASCWREFSAKRWDRPQRQMLQARLAREWPAIRERIAAVSRPSDALAKALRRAGAPTDAAHLGWPREFYRDAVRHAREIRNRYTFLDLAGDSGELAAFSAAS